MIRIIPEYISRDEETTLLSHLRKTKHTIGTGRNSISRYGSALPYKSRVNKHIPSWFGFIITRLQDDNIITSDSVTVNEYHPTQSIDWHIDSPSSGPTIVVLSLLSEAIMEMRNVHTHQSKQFVLHPRSLLIMEGEERELWEHSIQPLVAHRFSIVFRKGTNVTISK